MSRVRRLAPGVLAAVLLLLAGGCGGNGAPADLDPALGKDLHRVDAAVAARDYRAVRSAVRTLVNDTAQARVRGSITGDQADGILQAAAAVLDHLPAGKHSPAPTMTPLPSPSPSLSESPSPGHHGHGHGKPHEKGHGHGEGHDD